MGIQTGTDCGKQMGIIRDDGMLVVKLQRADEGCPQFTQKMERPAEEGNMPPDWTSTGQTGDGLVYNSLENGCGEVFLCRAVIDQRLDIGLGENTASGGDGIERLIVLRILIQSRDVGLEQGGHLIDEGTGAAGAGSIHTLINRGTVKIDDLRILPTELNRDIRLRRIFFQCR